MQIQLLVNDLDLYLPNILDATNNQKFWVYERDKHGTCSLNNFVQYQYFQAALTKRINGVHLVYTLANAGIVPDGSNEYPITDVVNAIKVAGMRINHQLCVLPRGHQIYKK